MQIFNTYFLLVLCNKLLYSLQLLQYTNEEIKNAIYNHYNLSTTIYNINSIHKS